MIKPVAKICAAALMLLSAPYISAQTAVPTSEPAVPVDSVSVVAERYPAGSIQTNEVADRALADVTQVRTAIEARFVTDQRDCYPKFFTTACLNKAKEQRRVDLLTVKAIEVEANSYIRHARVAERDRNLADKAAETQNKALLQHTPAEDKPADAGRATNEQKDAAGDAQRKARADAQAKKIEKRAEQEKNLKANEAAEEQKRAENIKRYEEKVKASAARQKEILEKKAEKEKALQQK